MAFAVVLEAEGDGCSPVIARLSLGLRRLADLGMRYQRVSGAIRLATLGESTLAEAPYRRRFLPVSMAGHATWPPDRPPPRPHAASKGAEQINTAIAVHLDITRGRQPDLPMAGGQFRGTRPALHPQSLNTVGGDDQVAAAMAIRPGRPSVCATVDRVHSYGKLFPTAPARRLPVSRPSLPCGATGLTAKLISDRQPAPKKVNSKLAALADQLGI